MDRSGAPEAAAGAPDEAAYPSPWRAGYIVAVLMLVTFTALLDRYLPAIMVEPMKSDLALSDTRISLIQGLAFSLFYCVAGVPLGRLVDRHSRRNLVIAAVLLWTGLTIWSGLAQSFTELFVARAGVGVAEAALAPAAYSMIADCYPPSQRGRAIAIYFSSLIIGSSASFMLGGFLLDHLSRTSLILPLVGELEPWRATFVLTALIGFPAALLGFTFREPIRRGAHAQGDRGALLAFMRVNARGMGLLYAAYGLMAFLSVIAVSWGTALYRRSFELPTSSAGMVLGVAMLAGGVLGAIAAGMASDSWARRAGGSGRFRVLVLALVLSPALLAAWALTSTLWLSYLLFLLASTMLTFGTSSSAAVIQDVVPNALRGQALAINQIGMLLTSGLSPTVVALVTDQVFADPAALPWSIVLTSAIFGALGLGAGLAAIAPYARMRSAMG